MSMPIGAQRPPLSQMQPQERRDYLAALDPASRRQAEATLGVVAPPRATAA